MSAHLFISLAAQRRMLHAALLLCLGVGLIPVCAQSASSSSSPATQAAPDAAAASSAATVLDRVVAVVNNQAILQSDLNQEMRLSVLEPDLPGRNRGPETPESALRRLIARALIRQQIREEDAQTAEPTEKEVSDRLAELRRQLPACARANCASAAGWQAFLAQHDLTEDAVRDYLHSRLEILNFIELRFRQGIHISKQEVSDYYQQTLLPQYLVGEPTPPLNQVAPRIEEILLQQKVNALFSGWLDNLRQQGEVEVLVPSLEAAARPAGGNGGSE